MIKYEYKAIKIKKETYERLKRLKQFIINFGIDELIECDTKDYKMESLSFDNIINLLLDIQGVV